MGFLDRLKDAVLPDVSDTPRPVPGATGGVPGRGRIVDTSGAAGGDADGTLGNRSTVVWTRKRLEVEMPERPGERTTIECALSEREFVHLRPGAEVPVRLHERSGAILGLDVPALEAEVSG